ncbi:MAG: response regulator [Ardenticatenaceae bacterium]
MSNSIGVVVADDHALVLAGLRSLLAAEPDISLLATATDGERLLDAVERFTPDVVISDVHMPYMDGLTSLPKIRKINPQTRVLFLTAFNDGQTLQTVLAAGADGLLLKTAPPEQTIQAIRQVMAGQLIFPAAARRWLLRAAPKEAISLSDRELEVLAHVAKGWTNLRVAKSLSISENTVKFHLQNIYQRLGVSNRTQASRWYHENYS